MGARSTSARRTLRSQFFTAPRSGRLWRSLAGRAGTGIPFRLNRIPPPLSPADRAEELNTQAVAEVARLRAAGGASLVSPSTAAALLANRAAAILMGGDARTRDALADCFKALEEDPEFQRARVRALSCLLKLGMFKAARELWDGEDHHDNATVVAVRRPRGGGGGIARGRLEGAARRTRELLPSVVT